MKQPTLFDIPISCRRCGQICQLTDDGTLGARPLRRTTDTKIGMCVNCAFTDFLKSIESFQPGFEKHGPKILLDERVQQRFATLFKIGESDAPIETINWERVIENWDLPLDSEKRT